MKKKRQTFIHAIVFILVAQCFDLVGVPGIWSAHNQILVSFYQPTPNNEN